MATEHIQTTQIHTTMARQKTARAYEAELRRMVRDMTRAECEPWLHPLIQTTAWNMVVRDRMQDEILELRTFTVQTTGSTGQIKNEVSPLLPHYDKIQRTITQQLTALGLTYDSTPSKVRDDRARGADTARDSLMASLGEITSAMNVIPDNDQ